MNKVELLKSLWICLIVAPTGSTLENPMQNCPPGHYIKGETEEQCQVVPPVDYFFRVGDAEYSRCLDCWADHRQILTRCSQFHNAECGDCLPGFSNTYNNIISSYECVEVINTDIELTKHLATTTESIPSLNTNSTPASTLAPTANSQVVTVVESRDWTLVNYVLLAMLAISVAINIAQFLCRVKGRKKDVCENNGKGSRQEETLMEPHLYSITSVSSSHTQEETLKEQQSSATSGFESRLNMTEDTQEDTSSMKSELDHSKSVNSIHDSEFTIYNLEANDTKA